MRHRRATVRRDGFTLIEVMIVVAIIVLLLALLLPAISAVRDSAKVNTTRAQMQMIAMAIDEYAQFWPAYTGPRDCDGDGAVGPGDSVYVNAARGLPPWTIKDLWWWGCPVDRRLDCFEPSYDPNRANECLAWCLMAKVGSGPYLKKPPSGLVSYVTDDSGAPVLFPPSGNTVQRVRLLDPWGTCYFYCWKAGDGAWVPFGRYPDGLASNPGELELEENAGQTFVLISAGPNEQFDFDPGGDGILGTPDDDFGDDIVFGQGR